MSNRIAAFLSTPFDALGAVGIIALGWIFGRITKRARARLLFVILCLLTGLIYGLPNLFHLGLWPVTALNRKRWKVGALTTQMRHWISDAQRH